MKLSLRVFRILFLESRKTFPTKVVLPFPCPVLIPHSHCPFLVSFFIDRQCFPVCKLSIQVTDITKKEKLRARYKKMNIENVSKRNHFK